MQKVISVNLNGNAYQFDEDAYGLLSAYLSRAQIQLDHNPDRAEIMADLEQAIAEKCGRFLGPHKTVVAAAEIQKVIDEMGPVDSGAAETGAGAGTGAGVGQKEEGKAGVNPGAPKRLYLIREGAMFFGVCNGLAAYFNLDVTIMRLAFVALAILTSGAWIVVYVIMMFVVPHAETPQQRAAAYGVPFNAQELIDRAKQKYADLKNSKQWRRQLKMQRRQWKQSQRAARQQARWAASAWGNWYPSGGPSVALLSLFGIFEMGLVALLIYAIYSLVKWNAIFGWQLPAGIPLWAGILILVAIYAVVVSPFTVARHGAYFRYGGCVYRDPTAADEILPLVALVVLVWLGYSYVPPVHQFILNLLQALHVRVHQ